MKIELEIKKTKRANTTLSATEIAQGVPYLVTSRPNDDLYNNAIAFVYNGKIVTYSPCGKVLIHFVSDFTSDYRFQEVKSVKMVAEIEE